jgi:galactoside O-acetyltransferase
MTRVLKGFLAEAARWSIFVIFSIPGTAGMQVRIWFLKSKCKRFGRHVLIDTGVRMTGFANIEIGDHANIMRNCSLHADTGIIRIGNNLSMNVNSSLDANGGEIRIGDDVLVAQNVVIRAADHCFDVLETPIREQGHKGGVVVVGDACWIAANVVITRNVTIGEHSIVGAGSVLTKDIAPFSIVGGVPAKLIKTRT